jgi:taurine dioxygenase
MRERSMATRVSKKLVVDEKANDYRTIKVAPLNPVIGAEIEGVDLSRPLSDDQLAEIRIASLEHHVLVFRDQKLSAEDHKRFARHFGRLHVHPYHAAGAVPEHAAQKEGYDPEILVVKADQSSRFVAGEEWHTDVTCDLEPPMGSMLYITQTPGDGGGDTMFASTVRAYDALSPAMKEFISGLTAVHDGAKPYTGGYGKAAPPGGWPRNTHPVAVTIPGTGRKSLFVNRGFTTRINELARAESDAVLEMLWRHVENHVEFQCRVRWTPDTLVFWDNRCTQHHAVWDYYPHSRYGQRVSIVGERPVA